jgi:hypothetical protein
MKIIRLLIAMMIAIVALSSCASYYSPIKVMKHGSGSDAPCYPARSRGMIGYGRQ